MIQQCDCFCFHLKYQICPWQQSMARVATSIQTSPGLREQLTEPDPIPRGTLLFLSKNQPNVFPDKKHMQYKKQASITQPGPNLNIFQNFNPNLVGRQWGYLSFVILVIQLKIRTIRKGLAYTRSSLKHATSCNAVADRYIFIT